MKLQEYIENYVAEILVKNNYDRDLACSDLGICLKTFNKHLWNWEKRTGKSMPRMNEGIGVRSKKEKEYSIFPTNQERLDHLDLKWRK